MFLLRQRPYSETSLLIDAISRNYGRLVLIAKGAKKKKSRMTGILLPFQRLVVSWSGKGEVKTMINADIVECQDRFKGERLFCGYYMNELILRTLHREESHERLFDYYAIALSKLSHDGDLERILRIFEKHLLRELGYGLHLITDIVSGAIIDSNLKYLYLPDTGPSTIHQQKSGAVPIYGESLIALEEESSFSKVHRQELKRLTRAVFDYHLDGRPLHSRSLYGSIFLGEQNKSKEHCRDLK
jgi:DNA repair protein RecO (recombination protein O)